MAVCSVLATDSRVRKTARSVQAMGYRVTLLHVFGKTGEIVEGSLDGVRTLGVPVAYHLSAWTAGRRLRRAQRPLATLGMGYPSAEARRVRAVRLAAREARLGGARPPLGLRLAKAAHRVRSKAFSVAAGRRERREDRRRSALPWQEELAHIADLESVFTPLMADLKPDVLHLHDIHLLGAGVNVKRRLAGEGLQVKVIYDTHEYMRGQYHASEYLGAGYTAMEADLIGEADGVVTISDAVADKLAADYPLAARPTVVVNTPPRSAGLEPDAGRPTVRDAAGLGPDVPLAVYAGGMNPRRNLGPLVEAFADLPGVHLAVVCVPDAACPAARELAATAAEAGVADRLHLLDPVPPEDVVRFLTTATLGVHPLSTDHQNHQLTLPNKVFDFVWAGLPVAVSQVKSMADFVREAGVGAVFDPENRASTVAAVKDVLANRERYALAARSPELRDAWSWEAQTAKLELLYRSLAPSEAVAG
jgi:glycosyltransferase involved in cell wall biosynthesis